MSLRRAFAFGFLGLVAALVRPSAGVADEHEPPYEENVAPLYLLISFDDSFIVTGKQPSNTIMVNVGSFVGGDGILHTRFAVNEALATIPLPEGELAPTFEQLADNSATLLGSFMTTDLGQIHMVTPAPGPISPDIQTAVFIASNEGLLDSLLAFEPFPDVQQIADTIVSRLPPGSAETRASVLAAVFNSGQPLGAGDFGATILGEGDMFPHESEAAALFHWRIEFDDEGTFSSDVCLLAAIDVHPGSTKNPLNLKKKGVVPIAILTTDGLDAADVDASTAHIGGVAPTKSSMDDVDGDGDEDLMLKWDMEDLVGAGVLTSSSTSITVVADLDDGSCIQGTDTVTVKDK
jgi:hypothetical protein